MMTLYSKNGAAPAPLPRRIVLSDGSSRTDPEQFTPQEIEEAGYIPAPDMPGYDPKTQHAPRWTAGGDWEVVDKAPEDILLELDGARGAAMRQIVEHINVITASALTAYPAAEVESWPIQLQEANTILQAGLPNVSMAPFLTGVCTVQFGPADDITRLAQVMEKAHAVKANGDAWAGMAAYVNGLRARVQVNILAADTAEGVTEALNAGIAEGDAFREQNGL